MSRVCNVSCYGPILSAVQSSGVYPNDSKAFPDAPLLASPEEITAAWHIGNTTVTDFVHMYFGQPGSDFVAAPAPDWSPNPPLVSSFSTKNATLHAFASALNAMWPKLTRRVSSSVLSHPREMATPFKHPPVQDVPRKGAFIVEYGASMR